MRIPPIIYFMLVAPLVSSTAQNSFTISGRIQTTPAKKVNWNNAFIGIEYANNQEKKVAFKNTFDYTRSTANYDIKYSNWQENLNGFNEIKNEFSAKYAFTSTTEIKAQITPSLNFQETIGISRVTILGGLELHQIIGSNLVLIGGVSRSSFLGSPKIVPIGAITYQINKQFSVSAGYPKSVIAYSNNERNQFRLLNIFNGTFYNLDTEKVLTNNVYAERLEISQITTAFEYERTVDQHWVVSFRGGYDSNKKYELTQKNNNVLTDLNIENSPTFLFGLKYKH